eukprot:g37309.t1
MVPKMGFGDRILNWVRLLYTNISSVVSMNGWEPESFLIRSGVRQGCPFSATLFVCCIEPFAESISKDASLRGVTIPGHGGLQVKASLYVNDVAVFCSDRLSVRRHMSICDRFELVLEPKQIKDTLAEGAGDMVLRGRGMQKSFGGAYLQGEAETGLLGATLPLIVKIWMSGVRKWSARCILKTLQEKERVDPVGWFPEQTVKVIWQNASSPELPNKRLHCLAGGEKGTTCEILHAIDFKTLILIYKSCHHNLIRANSKMKQQHYKVDFLSGNQGMKELAGQEDQNFMQYSKSGLSNV